MAIAPPVYTPSGSLFGTTPAATPYTYGAFGVPTTSAYNIWGSTGNPYYTASPGYTPGAGAPILPAPIIPKPVADSGSDYVDEPFVGSSGDSVDSSGLGDLTWGDKYALGLLIPGAGIASSLISGRFDTPGGGYGRLPWYEGSAGDGYGYTKEGYDQYAPGDTDRGIYDATTGERTWDDEFDDYNTGDLWAETGIFEGIGNIFSGNNWDGTTDEPGPVGDPNLAGPTDRWATTPDTTPTPTPYTSPTLDWQYEEADALENFGDIFSPMNLPSSSKEDSFNITPGQAVGLTSAASLPALAFAEKQAIAKDIKLAESFYNANKAAGRPGTLTAKQWAQTSGAKLPNTAFEKYAGQPGSIGKWLTARTAPNHFGPVEATIKGAKWAAGKVPGVLSALSPNTNIMDNATELGMIGLNPDGTPMPAPFNFGEFSEIGNTEIGDTDYFGNPINTDDFGNVLNYERDADIRAQQMNRNAFGTKEMADTSINNWANYGGTILDANQTSPAFTKQWSKYGGDILESQKYGDPSSSTAIESSRLIAIDSAKAEAARVAKEDPAQSARDVSYVGTAEDGYAATANRHGTTPFSEQTAMLAEQDMGLTGQTISEAIASKQPFGQEGDDSWSPNGEDVFHGAGYNWNGGPAEMGKEVGTQTDPATHGGGTDSSDDGGYTGATSDMAEAGFTQEDQDFIDEGFDDDSGGDGGGGGGSYIATATTQALGEEGLTVFNNWRDHMRNVVPEFSVSFGRYRVTAPKIVTAIDKKDNSKDIYKDIWDKHLKPIYALIVADRDSVKAQDDYRIMVRELMNKYLKGDK